ncbi:MAG: GNAT family N-acetyltransferase [Deltaproteobacteria bacterium]
MIFEDKQRHLVLHRSSNYTTQFVEFLQRIVWGSGGVRYTMHNVADTLNRLKNPHFFTLMEEGKLVAVTTLNHKTLCLSGKTYPAFYSYGIAVDPSKRGLGFGTLLAEQGLQYGLSQLGKKGLFYGYIEASNTASLKTITKVGRKSIGQCHALFISRLQPVDHPQLQNLNPTMKDQLVNLLGKQYANHALTDFDQSVQVDDYYIMKQGDEICAGLQCQRHQLTTKLMPGASGLVLVKVLPVIPVLRRLFPDRNLSFLTFGNIYFKNGMEVQIFSLMEALLARNRMNFAMIYMDKRSPVFQRLAKVGKFGILHPLIDVPVHVMGFFKGFSDTGIADVYRQPLYISMNDPV